ncbi:uncharacterized protein YueI [Gracilibacillus halotolerans]|uniref:Uncharacterized protein YueI n=1 Tax=Gracilibacillus halotolerans TaxID=74386 RepID=A0A841RQG8_9BACI|nr:YueI family protein [Gracilibacillus halotolerans]MBB6513164.1 uncharacterized protein YueI [Gracilibacillus halotolerans]
MSGKKLDDYITEGIYGPKEIKQDEKRKYLGTYRERVLLAIYKSEVHQKKGISEIKALKNKYPDAVMLLNDRMNINTLKPYRQLATDSNFTYRYIRNETVDSEYGVIIALDHAIEIENIHLPEENIPNKNSVKEKQPWWKRLFSSSNE